MTLVSFPIFRLDIVSSYDFLCIEVLKDADPVLHEKLYNSRTPWAWRNILPTNSDCVSISINDNDKCLYERRKRKRNRKTKGFSKINIYGSAVSAVGNICILEKTCLIPSPRESAVSGQPNKACDSWDQPRKIPGLANFPSPELGVFGAFRGVKASIPIL